MSARDRRIEAEARGLWAATHDGPPPAVDASTLLDLIVRDSGRLDYDRLHSPHLRPGLVMGGRRRG
jgi:hypothetical protein